MNWRSKIHRQMIEEAKGARGIEGSTVHEPWTGPGAPEVRVEQRIVVDEAAEISREAIAELCARAERNSRSIKDVMLTTPRVPGFNELDAKVDLVPMHSNKWLYISPSRGHSFLRAIGGVDPRLELRASMSLKCNVKEVIEFLNALLRDMGDSTWFVDGKDGPSGEFVAIDKKESVFLHFLCDEEDRRWLDVELKKDTTVGAVKASLHTYVKALSKWLVRSEGTAREDGPNDSLRKQVIQAVKAASDEHPLIYWRNRAKRAEAALKAAGFVERSEGWKRLGIARETTYGTETSETHYFNKAPLESAPNAARRVIEDLVVDVTAPPSPVAPPGREYPRQLSVTDTRVIDQVKVLLDGVHRNDVVALDLEEGWVDTLKCGRLYGVVRVEWKDGMVQESA